MYEILVHNTFLCNFTIDADGLPIKKVGWEVHARSVHLR